MAAAARPRGARGRPWPNAGSPTAFGAQYAGLARRRNRCLWLIGGVLVHQLANLCEASPGPTPTSPIVLLTATLCDALQRQKCQACAAGDHSAAEAGLKAVATAGDK